VLLSEFPENTSAVYFNPISFWSHGFLALYSVWDASLARRLRETPHCGTLPHNPADHKDGPMHQRAGLPFLPEVSPARWEQSFTSHFRESLYSEMQSLQIAQKWRCMARRCCRILTGLGEWPSGPPRLSNTRMAGNGRRTFIRSSACLKRLTGPSGGGTVLPGSRLGS
jgi:hypothetical protein